MFQGHWLNPWWEIPVCIRDKVEVNCMGATFSNLIALADLIIKLTDLKSHRREAFLLNM